MQPVEVAELALARLEKGPVFIPGLINRMLVALFTFLPRVVAVRLAGWGIRNALERGPGAA